MIPCQSRKNLKAFSFVGTATHHSIKSCQSLKDEEKTSDDWDDSGSDELFLQFLFVTMETLTNTLNQISSHSKLTTQLSNHPSSKLKKVEKSLQAELERLFPSCAIEAQEKSLEENPADDDEAWKPRGAGDEPKITTQTSIARNSDEKICKQEIVEMQEKRATFLNREAKQPNSESRKSIRQETIAKQDEDETETQQKHTITPIKTQTTPPLQPSDRKAEERSSVPTALRKNLKEDLESLGSNFRKKLSRWQNQSMSLLPSEHLPKTIPSSFSTRRISQPSPKLRRNFTMALTDEELPKKQPNLTIEIQPQKTAQKAQQPSQQRSENEEPSRHKPSPSVEDKRQKTTSDVPSENSPQTKESSFSTRRMPQPSKKPSGRADTPSYSEEPTRFENQPLKLWTEQNAMQTSQQLPDEEPQSHQPSPAVEEKPKKSMSSDDLPKRRQSSISTRRKSQPSRRNLGRSLTLSFSEEPTVENPPRNLSSLQTAVQRSKSFTKLTTAQKIALEKSQKASVKTESEDEPFQAKKATQQPSSHVRDNNKKLETPQPIERRPPSKSLSPPIHNFFLKQDRQRPLRRGKSQLLPSTPSEASQTDSCETGKSALSLLSVESDTLQQRQPKLATRAESATGDQKTEQTNEPTGETESDKKTEQVKGDHGMQETGETKTKKENDSKRKGVSDEDPPAPEGKVKTAQSSCEILPKESKKEAQATEGTSKLELKRNDSLVGDEMTTAQKLEPSRGRAKQNKSKEQEEKKEDGFQEKKRNGSLGGHRTHSIQALETNWVATKLNKNIEQEGETDGGFQKHGKNDRLAIKKSETTCGTQKLTKNKEQEGKKEMGFNKDKGNGSLEGDEIKSIQKPKANCIAMKLNKNKELEGFQKKRSVSLDGDELNSIGKPETDCGTTQLIKNKEQQVKKENGFQKRKKTLSRFEKNLSEIESGDVIDDTQGSKSATMTTSLTYNSIEEEDLLQFEDGEFEKIKKLVTAANTIKQRKDLKAFWTKMKKQDDNNQMLFKTLKEQSELYAPARIRLFGGCSHFVNNKVTNSSRSTLGGDLSQEAYRSSGVRGAVTTAMLETMAHMDSDKDMTFRDALVMLRSTLSKNGYNGQEPLLASSRIKDMDEQFRIIPDEHSSYRSCGSRGGSRRALMIGVNYDEDDGNSESSDSGSDSDSDSESSGSSSDSSNGEEEPNSHKDVERMIAYLKHAKGFTDDDFTILMNDGNFTKPTKKNILGAMKAFLQELKPGDVAFCYYSGRSGFRDDGCYKENDDIQLNGETLVPEDRIEQGAIMDDELFKRFTCRVPAGVTLTCLFDCEHSGTILGLPFVFSCNDTPGTLCASEPNFFPHREFTRLREDRDEEDITEFEDEEVERYKVMRSNSSDGLKSMRNSFVMRSQRKSLRTIQDLSKQAENYLSADIRMFASCDEGEDLHHDDVVDDDDDLALPFELPDASERTGGIFTTCFLKLVHERKAMSNREVLLRLGQELASKGYESNPILTCSRPHIVNKTFHIVPENFSGERRAVLIGILYKGQKGELRGSHKDVNAVMEYLIKMEGFKKENITLLMDDGVQEEPNRKNILNAYKNLAEISKPGDAVFCYFAGHGGQLEDDDGDEEDGYDETILPLDVIKAGPIRDDLLFEELCVPMPKGVTMTCIFDSSHAGTVLDLPFRFSAEEDGRELIPSFSHADVVKNYKDAMEAKGKSQNFWKSVMEQARIKSNDITSDNASSLCPAINEHAKVYAAADVLMIAACEDSRTAGETQGFFAIPEKVEFPGGVLTTALIESLEGRLLNGDGKPRMTNRDLLKAVCTSMERKGFLQRPIMSTSRIDAMEKSFGIIPDNFSGKRHAVVIGINYTKMLHGVLYGCHEDAWNIVAYLKNKEGFRDDDITVLMDDKKHTKPTRKNILQAYGKVAREAKPGDVVFTYFSGHGGQLEDQDGDEDDGFDEAIAPIDVMKNGLIRDDLLYKKLVCQMRAGVKLTSVFDCCHSGTVLDLPFAFEQNDTPFDLMKDKPNFFPHMAYARSVRESS